MKLNLPRNSTCYKITGTETYRASSTQILGEWGSNLQNIEKSMRRIYEADDGYSLVQVDQAGAEALIVSYIANKGSYRDLFLYGVKPHVFVALHVFADVWKRRFNDPTLIEAALRADVQSLTTVPRWKEIDKLIKSSDNWPSAERYYFLGKKIVHASSYGMMANTFVMSVLQETGAAIVLEKADAERYLQKFHQLFPEIGRWHIKVQEELKRTKTLRNLFGYPRIFTGFIGPDMFKEAYAFAPQSTVGCITHKAYAALQAYIEQNKRNWHLLGNCHDSYLVEAPDEEAVECALVAKEFMEQSLVGTDGTAFRMRAEAQVGKNWAPYKEKKNEQGLREL